MREAGKRPGLAGEVELVPGQLRNFFAALTGQGQEFDNASIGAIDLTGSPYDTDELGVIEHPVARCLPRWCRQSFGWRMSKMARPTHHPKNVLTTLRSLLAAEGRLAR